MSKRLSTVAALCVASLLLAARGVQAGETPNFVLIFSDDQGYQDLGCYGSPKIKTPNLDRMAEEGMRFTDFYVSAPVCSASRAALLTGCYCDRVDVTGVLFPKNTTGLNPDEITIAEMLKTRGYATACIGKWHLGHHPEFLPTSQGFDSYYGIPYSNDMTIDPGMRLAGNVVLREGATVEQIRNEKPKKNWVPLMRDAEVIEYPCDQSTLTRRYTGEAAAFIRANRDRPFFLYLANTMPHIPLFASDDFLGKSARGLYGDTIEEIDWSVGQILQTLRETGLDENTLVVYTSDNGPWLSMGDRGGCALPLRDGKFTTYEGGMRLPCIARYPGRIPAGEVSSEVAATIDLMPTFAELAGARMPDDRVIDGRSIWPLLSGKPGAASPHDAYFYRTAAVREGKWKLHQSARSTVKEQPAGEVPQLYDLSTDISEKHNVAADHPEIVERLTRLLEDHKAELAANRRPIGKLEEAEGKSPAR
jgi:arylsulfatase A-like enzyme